MHTFIPTRIRAFSKSIPAANARGLTHTRFRSDCHCGRSVAISAPEGSPPISEIATPLRWHSQHALALDQAQLVTQTKAMEPCSMNTCLLYLLARRCNRFNWSRCPATASVAIIPVRRSLFAHHMPVDRQPVIYRVGVAAVTPSFRQARVQPAEGLLIHYNFDNRRVLGIPSKVTVQDSRGCHYEALAP